MGCIIVVFRANHRQPEPGSALTAFLLCLSLIENSIETAELRNVQTLCIKALQISAAIITPFRLCRLPRLTIPMWIRDSLIRGGQHCSSFAIGGSMRVTLMIRRISPTNLNIHVWVLTILPVTSPPNCQYCGFPIVFLNECRCRSGCKAWCFFHESNSRPYVEGVHKSPRVYHHATELHV